MRVLLDVAIHNRSTFGVIVPIFSAVLRRMCLLNNPVCRRGITVMEKDGYATDKLGVDRVGYIYEEESRGMGDER